MNDPYVELARQTIEAYIKERRIIDIPSGLPKEMLKNSAGAFVSIHENGDLRGCIGTIGATTKNIASEIIQNAISASTRDPRFKPIEESELHNLEINVDVLSPLERVTSLDELDAKRYGVVVANGRRQGLLLPDLEGVDTVEDQVAIAAQKGGISLNETLTLYRFEVIRHK